MRIAFIGGGHMATALVGGLCARGHSAHGFVVADPSAAALARLARDFGVATTPDNLAAVRGADTVVLAVKPQQVVAVAQGLGGELGRARRLLISVAAGVRIADLARHFGPDLPIVRCMPNRPALIGHGVTALVAGPGVEERERRDADAILGACGRTVWLADESQLDVVTALSGSGPAYVFLLIEALEAAGVELGLPAATARLLAVETADGAGRLAAASLEAPETLRAQVTSQGGTTEAALRVLEDAGFRAMFSAAVAAATRRSAELAAQAGGG